MQILAAFLAALALALAGAQESDGREPAPEAPDPAELAWQRVTGAMGAEPGAKPITQFRLTAEVRASQGVRRNDLDHVTYRFLSPSYIRFGVGPNRETGRGPGEGRSAYWLRDGERVTRLDSRDYEQDRDLVRRMTTVARNVIALSDPSKLDVRSLALREAPSALLPESLRWSAGKLDWIELTSPDFDLYRDEPQAPFDPTAATEPPAERMFRVVLGADRETHRPRLVLLREEGEPAAGVGEPLLFELSRYRPVDGYSIPHRIDVRGFAPDAVAPVFQETPAQQIGVLEASLDPGLTPADFEP